MSVRKLGRNEQCWCGSGKKYKKCHLGRDKHKPVQPWEVDASIRSWNKSGECLHVGVTVRSVCGAPAIGSHTVPKKMLRQIARNGHVYRHSATMQDLNKTRDNCQPHSSASTMHRCCGSSARSMIAIHLLCWNGRRSSPLKSNVSC